jgi:ATP-dependent DNA helicase DinG
MITNADAPDASVLPVPTEFGLPPKFNRWRPGQDAAVLAAIDSPHRFVVQNMPTGSGKSLAYMAQAALTGGRTAILTSTKGLQQQLIRDFHAMGLVEIRGQNSYPCIALDKDGPLHDLVDHREMQGKIPSVEDGPCHVGVQCPVKHKCDYFVAMNVARSSTLLVTNYAMWMTAHEFTEGKLGDKDFDLLICDEAHDAADQVGNFVAVEISNWEIQSLLGTKPLQDGSTNDAWREWAAFHAAKMKAKIDDLEMTIKELRQDGTRIPGSMLRQARSLKRLNRKLGMLTHMRGEWVTEQQPSNYLFSPVWPAPYCERYLFRDIPKVVLVSATIRPKTLQYLGVARTDADFKEYDSTFPREHAPIIHVPTARLSFRTDPTQVQLWARRIDQIIGPRLELGRKGLIHTVSYARQKDVYRNSEHRAQMLIHAPDNTRMVVERFKKMTGAGVLVSPSVTTGWDFPYDECRFQIIGKVPFPDVRGALQKSRTTSDPDYRNYLTVMELVQMVGRGMRAEDDWCETFIIDDNIGWFVWQQKHLFPKWFLDSFRKVAFIPLPLQIKGGRP